MVLFAYPRYSIVGDAETVKAALLKGNHKKLQKIFDALLGEFIAQKDNLGLSVGCFIWARDSINLLCYHSIEGMLTSRRKHQSLSSVLYKYV